MDHGIDVGVTVFEKTSEREWLDCRNKARAEASVLDQKWDLDDLIEMDSLCGHSRKLRPVGPGRVLHHLQKDIAGLTSVAMTLLIAEFIYDEQQVDEIAAGTKFFVASIRVAV